MMTSAEAVKYMRPALENLYPEWRNCPDALEPWEKLARELGIFREYRAYQQGCDATDTPMSEELKELLTKLAGPYGKVVLAAFKAAGLPIKIY